jgi:homoserine dehydrogenase
MRDYKLALLGFGNVGQALGRLLLKKESDIQSQYDLTFSVTGIATEHHGRAINPNGIDLEQALSLIDNGDSLNTLSTRSIPADAFDFIQRCGADVLFENTPVNYQDGQPAVDYLVTALNLGLHAITANKGPVVFAYHQLTHLAKSNGCNFFFESAVMDGAPIFSLFRETLPTAKLNTFHGILNSTTNLILKRMEQGETFDDAVAYAQSIGIAETDPSGDVDGWDAAIKVAALVTVLMDVSIKPYEVDRRGISHLSNKDITKALKESKRWKLLCSAYKDGDRLVARVAPEMVPMDSPFYRIDGTTSIVQFETDVLGKLSIIESDPGPHTTAYGLLADFINAVKGGR